MEQGYKNCQSCGMPFRRDPEGGGTEADGTRSKTYCSHCYKGGKFALPDLTAEQMKERVKEKLKEVGFPGFLAGLITRGIPSLERWKNKP
jgi:hypothetical protein